MFIISLIISGLILINLVFIGVNCDSQIILGVFDNGDVSKIGKVPLMIYISLLLVFALSIIIPTYIKEKKINFNLYMAYLLLEFVLNILPYFGN